MIITIIILLGITIASLVYAYNIRSQDRQIIQVNEVTQQENLKLEQQLQVHKQELKSINATITEANSILQSLQNTNEKLREGAQRQAQSEYESKVAALKVDYDRQNKELYQAFIEQKESLEKHHNELVSANDLEARKLDDLKAKQLAYIQARQREEELEAQKDYYRLTLDEVDKSDIDLLRDIQRKIAHKEVIDKVIYETYYRPLYNTLMSHLFKTETKISGIYRITSLTSGQSYIGQSVDLRERMKQHIKTALSSSPATNKLYQAMKKDGVENFTFEVLEEVPKAKLNEREIYWIDFYQTKTAGLNKTGGGA